MRKVLRISQLNIHIEHSPKELEDKIRKIFNIKSGDNINYKIVSRSIDARKKPEIYYSYVIDIEGATERLENFQRKVTKSFKNRVSIIEKKEYVFPYINRFSDATNPAPIIIGSGPCGYFCGLNLARAGLNPIILEQGKPVDARKADIDRFWETGELTLDSNVQFGEGGAGTFSDGKLNTSIKDKTGRIQEVLRTFVSYGAKEEILFDSHPHVGTDALLQIMPQFREEIISLGGQVLFDTKVTDFIIENNAIVGIETDRGKFFSDKIVLACGHSARPLFTKLLDLGVEMQQKDFAVGFRVAHKQDMINLNQYGEVYYKKLPAAPYKLTYQSKSGRGVFSFCMCPGGYIVNASSFVGGTCVNGMSYSGRGSGYANSAIIISVTGKDFGDDSPLAGMCFQEKFENKAYSLANGAIGYQILGDLKKSIQSDKMTKSEDKRYTKSISHEFKDIDDNINYENVFKGQIKKVDLKDFLPEDMMKDFLDAMNYFTRYIKGFNDDDTIIAAVESRTSSPVRILRDETFQSNLKGLYPAGEGAGYAGGIVSASIDGIRIAEAICEQQS